MFISKSLTSKSFSWDTAYSLALASQLAYQNKAAIQKVILDSWQYDQFEFIDTGLHQGFVAIKSDSSIISFRGAEDNLHDWLINLGTERTNTSYGSVHKGFYTDTFTMLNAVKTILNQIDLHNTNLWVTGHSLGAAIATISIVELELADVIAGCYTFGQPRLFDEQAADFATQQFGDKHYRFANDNDLIANLPPGFNHAGKYLHFDRRGNLDYSAEDMASESVVSNESVTNTIETEALSKAEFNRLQSTSRTLQQSLQQKKNQNKQQYSTDSQSNTLDGLRDHRMRNYVTAVRRNLGQQTRTSKTKARRPILGRYDQKTAAKNLEAPRSPITATESFEGLESIQQELIPVTLRVKNRDWSPPPDVKINSKIGTILTAQVTQNTLDSFHDDPEILSVTTSRDSGKTECELSVPFIGASTFHGPPKHEFGDSCLIGVIDTGVDILHEAFLDENGDSRIVAFWDQTSSESGFTPEDIDPTLFTGLNYGRLYTNADIEQLRQTPSVVPSILRDPQLHGTHVASIAAGRACGQFAGGVAPEAKLILVRANSRNATGQPTSIGYSNSHIDGLGFLEIIATREDKPIVVNVSLGMNAGAHDGKSTLEIAFDEFSGGGTIPGRVVVKSAGNEHLHNGHAQLQAKQNTLLKLDWDSDGDDTRFQDYIELWYFGGNDLEFTLVDPAGNRMGPVSSTTTEVNQTMAGNECWLVLDDLHPDNGDALLSIQIARDTAMIQGGRWTLEIHCKTVIDSGRLDAWVERDDARPVKFVTHTSNEMTLSIPGTADTVICVAACKARDPLELTENSSHGPTRNFGQKPELCAPGDAIVAACANTNNHQKTIAQTGTSMAAPHVAGAIALKMSELHKDPDTRQLNANQFRQLLRRNPDGASDFHNGFGFGKLKLSVLE